MTARAEFILYVEDQGRARDFYRAVLGAVPTLDVPGMSEFALGPGVFLGLMPKAGIARLISPPAPDPRSATEAPRCELYLHVADPREALARAVAAGGRLASALAERDWGDLAGYVLDPDGHVLALARSRGG